VRASLSSPGAYRLPSVRSAFEIASWAACRLAVGAGGVDAHAASISTPVRPAAIRTRELRCACDVAFISILYWVNGGYRLSAGHLSERAAYAVAARTSVRRRT